MLHRHQSSIEEQLTLTKRLCSPLNIDLQAWGKEATEDHEAIAFALTAQGKAMDDHFENVLEVVETLRSATAENKRRSLQAVGSLT